MTKYIKYLVVILAIFLTAAACNKQVIVQQNTPTLDQTLKNSPNSNSATSESWQTYINTEGGFQIKYPADFTIDPYSTLSGIKFIDSKGNGNFDIYVVKYLTPDNIDTLVKAGKESFGENAVKKITIAGVSAVRTDLDSATISKKIGKETKGMSTVVFYHGGYQYSITTAVYNPDLMDGLVSTFQFTN